MVELYEYIAATIRRLRAEEKWTQEELAEKIGEPANTISRWETATYKPSAEQLEKLAKLFDESITVFFPEMQSDRSVPQALLSATRGLKPAELDAVIEYAEFTRARRALKQALGSRKKGPK
ncbi:MAG: helix-turn-helix transcriptional regulator [Xanthobacteraceae bacterium]